MQYATRHIFLVSVFSAVLAGTVAGGAVSFLWPRGPMPAGRAVPDFALPATEALGPNAEEERTIAIVQRASPAVVAIDVSKQVPARASRPSVLDDPALLDLPLLPPGKRLVGGGSGFFVSNDGLIVTNRHVVDDKSADYTVVAQDDTTYAAKVLDIDPVYDLAFLKIQATSTPFLTLGDSDSVQVGQSVLAIGNALAEFQNSVSKGIVSGKNRRLVAGGRLGASELIEEAIQTDAAINPGNSGGPLLDLKGRVIGVATAVSEDGQSLGFAIPANPVKRAIESVEKDGRIVRPWLGVRYFMVDKDTAKRDNLPVDYGALVSRGSSAHDAAVVPGSPAAKAGIQENDIILEIQGRRLGDETSLASALNRFAAGDEVDVKILRQGQEQTLKLKLAERAPASP